MENNRMKYYNFPVNIKSFQLNKIKPKIRITIIGSKPDERMSRGSLNFERRKEYE